MAKFVYNNAKNGIIGYKLSELNYGYYPYIFFEDNIDLCLNSHSANQLAKKLRDLISVCQQNLLHTQRLQKQAYDKVVKPYNYVSVEKVWLNRNISGQSKIENSK